MQQIVIGTAGHIDHGKTSLVEALTGTNTDTLLQEKSRGITIDLGFAYLNEEDANLIAVFTKEKKFPADAALLRAGQICSHVYLLQDCSVMQVDVEQKKTMLGAGSAIGVKEILEGKPMTADFTISNEGVAFVIPGTALEELLLLSPTLASSLVKGLKVAK